MSWWVWLVVGGCAVSVVGSLVALLRMALRQGRQRTRIYELQFSEPPDATSAVVEAGEAEVLTPLASKLARIDEGHEGPDPVGDAEARARSRRRR